MIFFVIFDSIFSFFELNLSKKNFEIETFDIFYVPKSIFRGSFFFYCWSYKITYKIFYLRDIFEGLNELSLLIWDNPYSHKAMNYLLIEWINC